MKNVIVIAVGTLASGCGLFNGETRTPAEEYTRQGCLYAVEAESHARAVEECPETWDVCEHRPAIMQALKLAQEACKRRYPELRAE